LPYDRGTKFAHYRGLDSLQEYLLVAQSELRVEHCRPQDAGRWLFAGYRAPGDAIDLDSVGCRLGLPDVYERVALSYS
jgi:Uma2 family endonuclease